jgi:hypothetical protein
MDFHCGQKTGVVRDETRHEAETAIPEEMSQPVKEQGMDAGIEEQYLQPVAGGGVARQSSI